MNSTILIGLAGIVIVVTNLYWWRRERTVRSSLTVSRDWETTSNTVDQAERRAPQEAAEQLDARVEDLPERVAALDEERRNLRRELDTVREQWANAWWTARDAGNESDRVLVVEFDHGELPDARALAKRAIETDRITLVAAHGDGSFAVAVGDRVNGDFSAREVATDLADVVGGGAGGNARLASGGGTTGSVEEGCQQIKEQLLRAQTAEIGG